MSASHNHCGRGAFVPKLTGDNGQHDCRPGGGTRTVGSPTYVLTVTNAPGDPPATCLLVLEDIDVDETVVPVTEDNGEIICVDDI
jgi:hypothetical protein